MPRFQTVSASVASLHRRALMTGGLALGVSACEQAMPLTASTTPRLDMKALDAGVAEIAAKVAPGVLGVALMNQESGEHWTINPARRFPMQSVFKAPLGAVVLSEVDAGRLSLDERVVLEAQDLSPPWSPIGRAWPARRDFTLGELLTATVADSDNTAADVLMRRIGGPGVVTAWLESKRLTEIRIDRYERELQTGIYGMASFRPDWRTPEAFDAARASVPEAARREAMAASLADPRDTATPRGMLDFLSRLDHGELLSRASTRRLLEVMQASPPARDRLKAGFPDGVRFAHKTGSSGAHLGRTLAANDVGIFTLPDRRSYAAAVFLAGTPATPQAQQAMFAALGRLL
ncbi:class A beta-lactamase, partial [Phenylobacterium sp.]|uniref:class A beta-lactamase n=1 Tax=Phenylobacterium sp. TaxID=1871053 RepID=UPI003783DBB3